MESLNRAAAQLCAELPRNASLLNIAEHNLGGATVWDFGVETAGGIAAGLKLAEICLAGRASVTCQPVDRRLAQGLGILVRTDHPISSCLGSQYAGWQIIAGKYFAMGSGPMRTLTGKEPLLTELQLAETSDVAVGVLEASKLPDAAVCRQIAEACGVPPTQLTLCVAPTGSIAGSTQIVARSVETALHKLHTLHFDLLQIRSAWGLAPLTPPTHDALRALGWTNDSILYGAEVVLYVDGPAIALAEVVERVPSNASADYGRPFGEIFQQYHGDFYKIDPHLFSPARVTMVSLQTGEAFSAGQLAPEILERSLQPSGGGNS